MTRLADYTTLQVGGDAEHLIEVTDERQLIDVVSHADAAGTPVLLLGGGSNVVISDAGFPGTAVVIRIRGIRRDGHLLTVAAGEDWEHLVHTAVAYGLSGMEALSGIPGSVGATPIQNVGAYGQDVSQTVSRVRALDRTSGTVTELTATECGFGYRMSMFKREPARFVILDVTFDLRPGPTSGPVRYGELARRLDIPVGGTAPLESVRSAVLELRSAKGMVLDPDDPDTRSVGSFFTNPVVSPGVAQDVERAAGSTPPQWPERDRIKLSAAWLVERSGFARGHGAAGARISGKHSLALTTRPGGTALGVIELAREIRNGVARRFGIELEAEPTLVGLDL